MRLNSILISWLLFLSNWCQSPFLNFSCGTKIFMLFFSHVAGNRNRHHILLNVCNIVCIEYLIAILPILLFLIGHLSNVILWTTALFSHLFIFPRLNRQLRSVLCLCA